MADSSITQMISRCCSSAFHRYYHYPHHPRPHPISHPIPHHHDHSHQSNHYLLPLPFLFLLLTLHLLLSPAVVSSSKLNSNAQQQSSSVHLPTIDGHIASISTPSSPAPPSSLSSPSSATSSLGCTAPEVLVNGSPSASIGGTVNGGPMGSISEIQFVGIVTAAAPASSSGNASSGRGGVHPSTTQKRICKIKCLNGLWIGPLCALQNAELFEPILRPCSLPTIGNATISEVSPGGEQEQKQEEEKTSGGGEKWSSESSSHRLLPHGSIIRVSCRPPGEYRLVGTSELSCVDGLWSGAQLPTCQLTTMHSNFSVGSPPTILYTLLDSGADTLAGVGGGAGGEALVPGVGVDSHGRLVVPPSSMLHLDCLFLKSFGQPRWTVVRTAEAEEEEGAEENSGERVPKRSSKSRRAENTGWAISSSAFSQYRLALYSASAADSGRYTCHTPNGLSNDIELIVKDVQCPPMESLMEQEGGSSSGGRHRVHSISGRRMNDRVKFGCLPGYQLVGARESVCTADGKWSRPVPRCSPLRCPIPDRPLDSKLFIEVHEGGGTANNGSSGGASLDALSWLSTISTSSSSNGGSWASVGTTIRFRCATGYRMISTGTSEAQIGHNEEETLLVSCTAEGRWSEDFPKCQLIVCPPVSPPLHGSITEAAGTAPDRRYLLGDFVQFQCSSGHQLSGGAAVSTCQADGTWSQQTPSCTPVCPYPPSLSHGHLHPRKVQYEALEKATVVCERSYSKSSSTTIICQSDGTWSEQSVQCVKDRA